MIKLIELHENRYTGFPPNCILLRKHPDQRIELALPFVPDFSAIMLSGAEALNIRNAIDEMLAIDKLPQRGG